eukprot:7260354-Prorocentrum_lima.AAC.1
MDLWRAIEAGVAELSSTNESAVQPQFVTTVTRHAPPPTLPLPSPLPTQAPGCSSQQLDKSWSHW